MVFVTDLSGFLRDPLVGALVVAIAVSLVKPILEVWLLPTNPVHDAVVRLMAIVFGILLWFWASLAVGTHFSSGLCMLSIINGAVIGIAAIGSYHALTATFGSLVGSVAISGEPLKPLEPAVAKPAQSRAASGKFAKPASAAPVTVSTTTTTGPSPSPIAEAGHPDAS